MLVVVITVCSGIFTLIGVTSGLNAVIPAEDRSKKSTLVVVSGTMIALLVMMLVGNFYAFMSSAVDNLNG